jgi:hypothetical protein
VEWWRIESTYTKEDERVEFIIPLSIHSYMTPYLHKSIFLIVFISCSFTSLAQSLPELQKQLKSVNSDRDKIYALDALANHYTWTEGGYADAKVYGQQMISVAEETSNKRVAGPGLRP